ncbi:MAG: hypothetical protein J6A37_06225 [Oscillospiraceae bacterium]|nr:hypothetical protein [Oscillospiraceae bacterium]
MITLQLDTVSYTAKPKGAEIAGIKTRLCSSAPQTVTLQQFSEGIVHGHSFTPAVLVGGAKTENWQSQQLFCLDIDNEDKSIAGKHNKQRSPEPLTVDNVLSRCSSWGLSPALIYETFSSSTYWKKFRIVFISEANITDRQTAEKVQLGIMELFPECDRACKNADRLFFGGKNVLYIDESAKLSAQNIAELKSLGAACASSVPVSAPERDKQLSELKYSFDFLDLIRSGGSTERRAGRLIQFNPCPICGHKDDFYYYPDTKTFMCFGSNGNCGVSVIDFIIHREHLDRSSAIKYFKYELCGISEAEDKANYQKRKMIERHNIIAPMNEQVAELPPYFFEKINERTGEITYTVTCPALAEHFRNNQRYFWLNTQGSGKPLRYLYSGGVYFSVSDEEIKGIIKHYITDYMPLSLKMKDVDEVFKDLCCDNVFQSAEKLNADENIINFENGLLYLDTMELKPHTPNVLSTIQIPCKWNPYANTSPVFSNFLNTLTNGDIEVQRFLMQFIGVAISNTYGYRMKSALFMVGSGNTGKSQLKSLVEKLIGERNCSPCNLKDLEERFGTAAIYGKRLIGSSDMSFMTVKELKTFKSITGGDSVPIEFKGRDSFQYVYKGLVWFCTNQLPRFGGDRGNHVYDRIICVKCDNVIPPEQQDKYLLDKMYAEREAIVYSAVLALKSVIDNSGQLSIPDRCLLEKKAYRIENSPVLSFYEECCCERKTATDNCTCAKMYEVFKAWCRDNSNYTPKKSEFRRELADTFTGGDVSKLIKKVRGIEY